MGYRDVGEVLKDVTDHPWRTAAYVVIAIAVFIVGAILFAYFSKIGENAATPNTSDTGQTNSHSATSTRASFVTIEQVRVGTGRTTSSLDITFRNRSSEPALVQTVSLTGRSTDSRCTCIGCAAVADVTVVTRVSGLRGDRGALLDSWIPLEGTFEVEDSPHYQYRLSGTVRATHSCVSDLALTMDPAQTLPAHSITPFHVIMPNEVQLRENAANAAEAGRVERVRIGLNSFSLIDVSAVADGTEVRPFHVDRTPPPRPPHYPSNSHRRRRPAPR